MMTKRYTTFLKDEQGLAFLEFALMLPFILLLTLGVIEMSRFILVNQRLDKVSNTMADLVTQTDDISTSDIDLYFGAVQYVMNPYPFSARGRIIISSVKKFTGVTSPVVQWQHAGGGTLSKTSQVGSVNGNATLPTGFTMQDDEDIIVSEVFYHFDPIFSFSRPVLQSISAGDIYKITIYKPRLGAMTTLH